MGFLTSALEMYHLFALWENDAHGYGSICGLPNIKYSIKLLVWILSFIYYTMSDLNVSIRALNLSADFLKLYN